MTNSSQSVLMEGEAPLGYHSIQIEGEECDEDFTKCADVFASVIQSRQAYKSIDRGQREEAFSMDTVRTIALMAPPVPRDETLGSPPSNMKRVNSTLSYKRYSSETNSALTVHAGNANLANVPAATGVGLVAAAGTTESPTEVSVGGTAMGSVLPKFGSALGTPAGTTSSAGGMMAVTASSGPGAGGASSTNETNLSSGVEERSSSYKNTNSNNTPSTYVTFHDGIFTFPQMKFKRIEWEQYVADMRSVYSAIENGPCLSVARMRLTAIGQKFQLYSLLNSEHENNYDEYIKGGVYANCTKVDNALMMRASVPAPTLLDYIVTTAQEHPRMPLFIDQVTGQVVTISQYLEQGGVKNPEEMTIGGLGMQPSLLTKKNVSPSSVMLDPQSNPSGEFGATLLQCFLSMGGPNNGDLYGGLLRSELERAEFKEQHIVCTERIIKLHGHHTDEVREVAAWLRNQGFHNFNRNMWVLALSTAPPISQANTLPIQAKTVEEQLKNIFYPLFMATMYATHPEWRDVAQMLSHTSAISVCCSTRNRTKNLSAIVIPPSAIKYGDEVSDYYYFYYFWSNFATLNALRRGLGMNLLQFTSSVAEKPPSFDQLVCGFLLSDVVYHASSLRKSWVMQYVYTMCRIGVVLSPLRDNLLGLPYFEHPVVQFFHQGMQVSLTTSSPLHYHSRVDQPLVEEYATLMKLHSLTPQDICELARNSVLNSNMPMTMKQEWLGQNFTPLGSFGNDITRSCVCNYRLQFRQETLLHEATLLNLVRTQVATQKGLPPPPVLHPASVSECIQMPDLVQQFKSSRRMNYIDKHVVYPRIHIQDVQVQSQSLFDAAEMIRQVVMLRRKYTHSYATDVKVEDVFSNAHQFNENNYEYNNYYGVFVLSGVGKCPSWSSFIPTMREFIKDVNTVRRAVTSSMLQRLCSHRLNLLERKFLLHLSMNISNEAGKREEKEWNNRDFFTAHKVDNNVFSDAGLNARTLLEYFVDKVQNHGDDVVFEEENIPVTLRQLIARYHINVNCITVDELNYQMSSHPDLWSIFLSPDNFMQGRYFAELIKRKVEIDKEDVYGYTENRLRIYGTSPDEWYMLANWFDRYGMASSQNRWMIAFPRNYHKLRRDGVVKNFGNFIDHLFSPLWDISLHPAKNPRFHYFLAQISGFDCVDVESKIDSPLDNTFPHDWNTEDNPPYGLYLYYMWANIASLNEFRASRGLGTFSFRPQCGEFGHGDHLIAGFLLANSINHGVTLARHPVLEYLYYVTQLGVAMSPLSNTSGACAYLENPFPQFFHRGLNVSLATNQPLYFHFTREPLIEEYSIAAKLWKFEFNDLSEIARNSVLQSGFPHSWKEKALGKWYFLNSTHGNDVRKTRISDIRVAFRFEAYHSELDFLDSQLGSVQRVPRAMRTLEEEQSIVDEAPLGTTDPAVVKYMADIRAKRIHDRMLHGPHSPLGVGKRGGQPRRRAHRGRGQAQHSWEHGSGSGSTLHPGEHSSPRKVSPNGDADADADDEEEDLYDDEEGEGDNNDEEEGEEKETGKQVLEGSVDSDNGSSGSSSGGGGGGGGHPERTKIDLASTKEFLMHDITFYQHRIREVSTCLMLLADRNNNMASELNSLVEHRAMTEATSLGTLIRGNIVGMDSTTEKEERKTPLTATNAPIPPGPELWLHEENRL